MNATIVIERPPAQVFEYIADVANDVNWRKGVVRSGLRSEGPVGVGSIGYAATEGFETVYRVTTLEQDRIDWEFIDAPFSGYGGYRIEPFGEGARFTLVADIQPSGLMKLLGPLFGRMVRRSNDKDVATLKRLLESSAAPSGK